MKSAAVSHVQQVHVVNGPDPIAADSLRAAWYTFDVTLAALLVAILAVGLAGWALVVAINDARRNQIQLELAQAQFKKFAADILEQSKKPYIQVQLQSAGQFGPKATILFDGNVSRQIPLKITVPLVIRNVGERDSNGTRVKMLIRQGRCLSINGSTMGETRNEVTYVAALLPYQGTLGLGNGWREIPGPQIEIRHSDEPLEILVKAYDEFGNEFPPPKAGQLFEFTVLELTLQAV